MSEQYARRTASPDDRHARIVELYKLGVEQKYIAQRVGISRAAVGVVVRKHLKAEADARAKQ